MVAEQIAGRGITDPAVLKAMQSVPRHRFVPQDQQDAAYLDRALPIGEGQTISQPYMVAAMTQALEPGPGQKVLEIGTGSGYQTAILASIAEHVTTIERRPDLAARAARLLGELGYSNVTVVVGDGSAGLPRDAPFDRIIVTAGAPDVPEPLVSQLADGGRLVIPVGPRQIQDLVVIRRRGDSVQQSMGEACVFVPLVGEHGWVED